VNPGLATRLACRGFVIPCNIEVAKPGVECHGIASRQEEVGMGVVLPKLSSLSRNTPGGAI